MSVLATLIVGELKIGNPGKEVSFVALPNVGDYLKLEGRGMQDSFTGIVRRVIHEPTGDGQEPRVYVFSEPESF